MSTDNSDPTPPTAPLAIDPTGAGNKPPNGCGPVSTIPTNQPNLYDVPLSVGNLQIIIRLVCGYALIVLSITGVSWLLVCSLRAVDLIQFTSPNPFTYDYARLSVRGLVTLAGVFFCHRMIQVGERMVIPVTLLRNSEDLKLLLGGEKNTSMPSEHIKELVKLIKSMKD